MTWYHQSKNVLCGSLLAAVLWLGGGVPVSCAPAASQENADILARIERAAKARTEATATLSAMERELVLLLNFEQPDVLLVGEDGFVSVPLSERHYTPGRFGQGFYFEMPQKNLLPPELADIEDDVEALLPIHGAELDLAAADTPFGKQVLSVNMTEPGSGLAFPPQKVRLAPGAGHEKTVSLLASCYVKGPRDAQITLGLQFAPAELLDPKTKEPVTDRQEDKAEPVTITLNGEWQRVACVVSGDVRLRERIAGFSITLASARQMTLQADGFQFEPANYYPYHRVAPTTWCPGGTSYPASMLGVSVPSLLRAFPTHEGTISLWTLTPAPDSNQPRGGAGEWFWFGRGWNDPDWAVGTYRLAAGPTVDDAGKSKPYYTGNSLSGINDGNWHHVAIAWDATTGALFKDGQMVLPFKRTDPDISKLITTYGMHIGGGRGAAACAIMDEIAVFKRGLTAEEITSLAAAPGELRASTAPVALSASTRTVFYRDEVKAQLGMQLASSELPNAPVRADFAIEEFVAGTVETRLAVGKGTATFEFSPQVLKAGDYTVRVAITAADDKPAGYRELPVTIAPALKRGNFLVSTWGGGLSEEQLDYYEVLGFNQVNMGFSSVGGVENLGRLGFWYDWHLDYNRGGNYSPAAREDTRNWVTKIAKQLEPLPNWRATLINSETGAGGLPDEDQRQAWFDAWVEKEFGAPVPPQPRQWAFGGPHNHIMCFFPEGEAPGPDGVYHGEPITYRWLKWWSDEGGLCWRVNALISDTVHEVRPDVMTWTDPVHSRGQFAEVDAGGSWAYSTNPRSILNSLQSACHVVHSAGKPYWATLGLNYVAGIVTTEPDEVKKDLCPTPDDAIQQAWVATALVPSDGLFYWDCEGYLQGEAGRNNRYAVPGSAKALGEAIKQDLMPLGTMLQGVGSAPRDLALLLPGSTLWFQAGEGGFNWGAVHYPNIWKGAIAASGLPYDVVGDDDITPGSLTKYKTIIFPVARFVSARVHRELTAAANAGTQVIVDSYCGQHYPNMTKLEMKYDWGAYTSKTDE
ncbi:MAG: LamG domain-containing protein, partial [candidate division WS1 bacterium]|nr:LamG domain-containing protein [candidate division WS1 bacterium]